MKERYINNMNFFSALFVIYIENKINNKIMKKVVRKKRSITILLDGISILTLGQVAREVGINYHTLYRRWQREDYEDFTTFIHGKKIEIINNK